MNARKQLNTIYIYGSIIGAALLGVAFGSSLVFLIALPIIIAIALQDGSIRFSSTKKTKTRNHRGHRRN